MNRYPLIRWKLQGYEDNPAYSGQTPVVVHLPLACQDTPSRTQQLWTAQGGLCFWCGVLTLRSDQDGYYLKDKKHPKLDRRAATLDHLYSKLHPYRSRPVKGPRHVMACHACNGKRSKEECEAKNRGEPMLYVIA